MDNPTLVEIISSSQVDVTDQSIPNLVSVEQDGDDITLIIESVTSNVTVDTIITERLIEVFDGQVYLANADESIVGTRLRLSKFTITTNGQTQFNLSSTALKIFHVIVNQIDYINWCEITPPGSGQVVYTKPPQGYAFETGDAAIIVWSE